MRTVLHYIASIIMIIKRNHTEIEYYIAEYIAGDGLRVFINFAKQALPQKIIMKYFFCHELSSKSCDHKFTCADKVCKKGLRLSGGNIFKD